MIAFWTILHGIVAMALVGAITHQGFAVWRRAGTAELFVDRFRAIPMDRLARFANSIAVLYVATFALGAFIYPTFVLEAKGALVEAGRHKTITAFQLKEHIAVIGLGLLPVYWHYWRTVPLTDGVQARRLLTTVLMLGIWWNLVVGHVVNNVRGLV